MSPEEGEGEQGVHELTWLARGLCPHSDAHESRAHPPDHPPVVLVQGSLLDAAPTTKYSLSPCGLLS